MDADFPSSDPRLPSPLDVWSALLAVLEALPPCARAALLLHDVFGATLEAIDALFVASSACCCRPA